VIYLTVNVTAEDIRNGVREASRRCPIARAINRTLNVEDGVEVCEFHIQTDDDTMFSMPAEATRFVEDFDHGKPVEPFEFTARRIS
jgi:hypothetical protein